MLINSVTQSPQNICYGKLIVKPGCFNAMKQAGNFPPKDNAKYKAYLLDFYKKLILLKKRSEKNVHYNVVFKPQAQNYEKGKLVLEDCDGNEFSAFQMSFRKLFEFYGFKPKKTLTKEEEPNIISRYLKNKKIMKDNIQMERKPRNYTTFFDIVIKRIEHFIEDAECLEERRKIKLNNGELI